MDSRRQKKRAPLSVALLALLIWLPTFVTAGSISAYSQGVSLLVDSITTSSTISQDCPAEWEAIPSPKKGQHDSYAAVQFAGPNDGWAVGNYSPVTDGPIRTLVARWDGTAWKTVPSLDPSNNWNQLLGISILSSNDVWAVGTTSVSASRNELVLHWDGKEWIHHSTPNSESNSNELTDIVAIAPNDVWAVGYYYISFYRPYALHWDGSAWTHIDMPLVGTKYHHPQEVVAVKSNDVWTVGYMNADRSEAQYSTLIERWDGASWDLVPSPNPGAHDSVLMGAATVPNSDRVWAVGWYRDIKDGPTRTLITRWDGTEWSVVPSPNMGDAANGLMDVIALADDDVWAVGNYEPSIGAPQRTLVMHWDGTGWSIVPSASSGTGHNALYGIALAGDRLWAVGQYGEASGTESLITTFDRRCPIPAMSIPTSTPTQPPTPTAMPTSTPAPMVTNPPPRPPTEEVQPATAAPSNTPVNRAIPAGMDGSTGGNGAQGGQLDTVSFLLGMLFTLVVLLVVAMILLVLLLTGIISINPGAARASQSGETKS